MLATEPQRIQTQVSALILAYRPPLADHRSNAVVRLADG